jgi:hypothetical protein
VCGCCVLRVLLLLLLLLLLCSSASSPACCHLCEPPPLELLTRCLLCSIPSRTPQILALLALPHIHPLTYTHTPTHTHPRTWKRAHTRRQRWEGGEEGGREGGRGFKEGQRASPPSHLKGRGFKEGQRAGGAERETWWGESFCVARAFLLACTECRQCCPCRLPFRVSGVSCMQAVLPLPFTVSRFGFRVWC